MASHGFLPANAAQGLHLLSEPPATEVLTGCPSPLRAWGLGRNRGSKGSFEAGLSRLLGCEPLNCLILERKERKECFADFGHTPYVVTCERKQQPIHFNTCMPLESYLYDRNHGIGSLRLRCTSAEEAVQGKIGRTEFFGLVDGGEHDPLKAEHMRNYWCPVRSLNSCPLVVCSS